MKKTVFSALIILLSLMLTNASFAETPNKTNLPPIPLQLDGVDIQETLDLGNQ
jgi:hypothetical protein